MTAPNGVAIDHAAGRVYWGSYTNNKVSFANLDNTGGGGDIDTTGATVNGPTFPVLLRGPSGVGAPSITGGSTPGSVLTCSPGQWSSDLLEAFLYQAPAGFAYQWSAGGSDIGGATSPRTPRPGRQLRLPGDRVQPGRVCFADQRRVRRHDAPAPKPPAKASFAGSRSVITVNRKRRFSFSFHADAGLTGAAVFKSVKAVSVSRKRVVALARKSFTVPAGRKVTLRIRLSKKNYRILKRA